MDLGSVVALVAAGASVASWWAVKRQLDVMRDQTVLQREIAHEAVQPYLWADMKPNPAQGFVVLFVLGNSGPTTATNVRVTIDPPIRPEGQFFDLFNVAQERLRNGIESLAPGRTLEWSIGRAPEMVGREEGVAHRVMITADGPHGTVRTSYVIDLRDMAEMDDSPVGSLHHVTKALDRIASELKRGRGQ